MSFVLCRLTGIILCLAVYVGPVLGQSTQPISKYEDTDAREHAVRGALQYAGFEATRDFSRDAVSDPQRVTIEDDRTPFLGLLTEGQWAWRTDIADVVLSLERPESGATLTGKRDFSILIDSVGTLLKIVSTKPGFDKDEWHIPSAKQAGESLSLQRETYVGFVNEPPPVSFIVALGQLIVGDPTSVDHLEATCVMHQNQGEEPKATWIIQMYGEGASVGGPEDLPFYVTNHLRLLVDATTGDFLFGDHQPQPTRD